jgi:hypothetical protein
MSDPMDRNYARFNREHPRLVFASRAAFALLFVTFAYEWYLISHSTRQVDSSTNRIVQMKVRGGHIFVRPFEYYLDRGGYFIGASTLLTCLVAVAIESSRMPPK